MNKATLLSQSGGLCLCDDFCMGGMKMQAAVKYHSEVKTVPFGGRTITLESLTPILSPKERAKRKKEIEKRLYDVFIKYER